MRELKKDIEKVFDIHNIYDKIESDEKLKNAVEAVFELLNSSDGVAVG